MKYQITVFLRSGSGSERWFVIDRKFKFGELMQYMSKMDWSYVHHVQIDCVDFANNPPKIQG